CVTHNGVNSAPDSRRVWSQSTVSSDPPIPRTGTKGVAEPRVPGRRSLREKEARGKISRPEGGGAGGGTSSVPHAAKRIRCPRPRQILRPITDVTSARTALGRAALLRCEAMAVPPADFQWYKDDRLLSSGTAEGLKVQTERTPLDASFRQRERPALTATNVSSRQPVGSIQRLHAAVAWRLGAGRGRGRAGGRVGAREVETPGPPLRRTLSLGGRL
uniref:Ig-like domain-containing protein n=1 Tax=Callithrix jacchus TaxID=9483 RepID=A0A8I4A490_CALJA